MANTASTLSSLANLLKSQSTIVVKDHIQKVVKQALDSLAASQNAIYNKDFHSASQHARVAIKAAELAFFDPTMLPLLYFPGISFSY